MRSTVIGLAAAAAIITAGSTLSASACPYHEGYGGPRGEYGRSEYRPEFGRREYPREFGHHEYPRREFGHREYRREFERREHPRREFGGGEYPRREYRRGEYGERVATVNIATEPERLRCALCQRNSPARLCRRDVSKWDALQVGEWSAS